MAAAAKSVEDLFLVEAQSTAIRCFFDVAIGEAMAGRITFELYPRIAPKTVENFRCLCTGEKTSTVTGKRLHYAGAPFHRIIKDFMIQGGDFTLGNGTGGESIYGAQFDDERFIMKHDKPYLLSMANRGKNTNSSQFFITTVPTPHLDNKHVVFGRVVEGVNIVQILENQPVGANDKPHANCRIANCGELVKVSALQKGDGKKAKKEKKAKREPDTESSEEESSSDSDADSKQEKKRRKKEKKSKKKKKKKKKSKSKKSKKEKDADGAATDDLNGKSETEKPGVVLAPPPPPPKRSRSGRVVRGRGSLHYRTPSPEGSRFGRDRYGDDHRYDDRRRSGDRWRRGSDRTRSDDRDWRGGGGRREAEIMPWNRRRSRSRSRSRSPGRGFGRRNAFRGGRGRPRSRSRSRSPSRSRSRSKSRPRRSRSPSPSPKKSDAKTEDNTKENNSVNDSAPSAGERRRRGRSTSSSSSSSSSDSN